MYLLLCGKPGAGVQPISTRLIQYFSYRSTACYEYNYLTPLKDIEEAASIVLSRYMGIEEIENLTGGSLSNHLYSWGGDLLARVAQKQVAQVTARWDELKLHYIAILHGIPPIDVLDFEPAFKVLLKCADNASPRRESCLGPSFDDYAVGDIFDLVVDTSVVSPDEAATLIGESLHDKMLSPFKGTKDKDILDTTVNGSST